jgi:hypothetical protein
MPGRCRFSVHDPFRTHCPSPEGFTQSLMTQAYPQHGYRRIQRSEQLNAYAGFARRAWAGGNHHARRRQCPNFFHASFVVSQDRDVRAQFAQELDKIEGERIVIIDDE